MARVVYLLTSCWCFNDDIIVMQALRADVQRSVLGAPDEDLFLSERL